MIENRLKVLMAERNFNNAALAELVGVKEGTISKYRNHLNSIDIKMLDSLCKALRCTPGDILKYKDVNLSQDETL